MTSVADNTGTLSADVIKIEDQYLAAEAELAEQTARVKEIETSLGATGGDATSSGTPAKAPARRARICLRRPTSSSSIKVYSKDWRRLGRLSSTFSPDILPRAT